MSTQAWANHLLWASHAAIVAATAFLVNQEVPEPYMDEIFHIGQAKTYCAGRWTQWDPKLTTPPGLYIPSALLSRYFHLPMCSVPALRSINASLVAAVLPVLLADLLATIRHGPGRQTFTIRQSFREALAISAFPLTHFFAFLYYTDVSSLVVVLLCYRQALHRHYTSSAILGLASLLIRQTNIIWVALSAFEALAAEHGSATSKTVDGTEARRELQPYDNLAEAGLGSLTCAIKRLLRSCIVDISTTLRIALPFAPVLFAFLAFMHWNHGIVLGDKTMHVAVLHIPQVYYFTAFVAVMSAPVLGLSASTIKAVLRTIAGSLSRFALSALSCLSICWTIQHYTIEHPFLLADNRHYPFYLWRRIINVHPLARYALAPAYLIGAAVLFRSLAAARTWKLLPFVAFIGATALTSVPSPLLEFRYFIVPYVLLRLHLRPTRRAQVVLEHMLYAAVNAVTIYVFLYRRFRWPTEDGWQRFMW